MKTVKKTPLQRPKDKSSHVDLGAKGTPMPTKEARRPVAPTAVKGSRSRTSASEPETVDEPKPGKTSMRLLEQRWGSEIIEAGWVAIPAAILERQHELKLKPAEFNVLVQILRFWWTADNLPRPAKSTIATAIAMDPRTVQRRIAKLKKLGLIEQTDRKSRGKGSKGNMSSLYSFEGLKEKVLPIAREINEERARIRAEKQVRLKREGWARPSTKPKGGAEVDK